MKEKYSKIPVNTFQSLQINAGMLLSSFNPATGTVSESAILGPTSGGSNFSNKPTFKDWGEGVDNCPKNTKELMRFDSREIKISGSFAAATPELIVKLSALADSTTTSGVVKIALRDELKISDFHDLWLVGDYGDVNTGDNAAFIAIKMMDVLSTGGFQLQTTDKDKGKFSFEFTAHYSIDAQDTVPCEIYVKNAVSGPYVILSQNRASITTTGSLSLTAVTNPANATVTWSSNDSDVATVSGGTVTPVAAGHCLIIAKITEDGKNYDDMCVLTVTAASA